MIIYKTQVGDEVVQTTDLQKIQEFGQAFEIIEIEDPTPIVQEKTLEERLFFCENLRMEFLKDNDALPFELDPQTSIAMLQGFALIEQACLNGSVNTLKFLVEQSTINAIYTQERKNKYLTLINNFLGL